MTASDIDTVLAVVLAADFATPLERARHAMRHGMTAEIRTAARLLVMRLERKG